MERLTRFALRRVPSLVICLLSFGTLSFAQEVDVPSGRGSGLGSCAHGLGRVDCSVQQRIDLKFYGFYIGELKAPPAQFDATFRATKFLFDHSQLSVLLGPCGRP